MYNKPISDVSNRIVSHGSAWADNVTGHPVLAAQLFQHFSVLFLSGLCRSYRGNRTATKCTLYLELQVHVKIISKCFWITTLSDTMPPLGCCRAEARASHMQSPGHTSSSSPCFKVRPTNVGFHLLSFHTPTLSYWYFHSCLAPPLFTCIWFLTLNSPILLCLVLLICYGDGLLLCNPSRPRTSGNPPSSFSHVIAMYL